MFLFIFCCKGMKNIYICKQNKEKFLKKDKYFSFIPYYI